MQRATQPEKSSEILSQQSAQANNNTQSYTGTSGKCMHAQEKASGKETHACGMHTVPILYLHAAYMLPVRRAYLACFMSTCMNVKQMVQVIMQRNLNAVNQ